MLVEIRACVWLITGLSRTGVPVVIPVEVRLSVEPKGYRIITIPLPPLPTDTALRPLTQQAPPDPPPEPSLAAETLKF